VRPHASQARVRVFELGQFDLELGLPGLGAGGEDVEDQLAAVEDFDDGNFLEFTDLARREVVIENDHISLETPDAGCELRGFAAAEVRRGVDPADFLLEPVHDDGARALGQGRQLGQVVAIRPGPQDRADQDGPFLSDSQRLPQLLQLNRTSKNAPASAGERCPILTYRPAALKKSRKIDENTHYGTPNWNVIGQRRCFSTKIGGENFF
jgi:hypothetical protein